MAKISQNWANTYSQASSEIYGGRYSQPKKLAWQRVRLAPGAVMYSTGERDNLLSDLRMFRKSEQRYDKLLFDAFKDVLDQFKLGYKAMIGMYALIFGIDVAFVAAAIYLFTSHQISSLEAYISLLGALLTTGLILMVKPVQKLQDSRTSQAKMLVILYNWFYNRYNWVECHKSIQYGVSHDQEFVKTLSQHLCEHTSDTLDQLDGCLNEQSKDPR